MEYIIGPVVYCIFVAIIVILGWFFIKKLNGWSAHKYSINVTNEVRDYLKAPQNRRQLELNDLEKIREIQNKKIISYMLILLCVLFAFGIKEGFSATLFLSFIVLVIVFFIAIFILSIKDKKELNPSYDGGIWIEKAYILHVIPYRGYKLIIAYFDFFENEIKTISIQIDRDDVGTPLHIGDYIDIVLSVKSSRLKYCRVVHTQDMNMYKEKITNFMKKEFDEIVQLCEGKIEEYGDHASYFLEPAKEEEILEWERQTGTEMPEDYKEWLKLTSACQMCSTIASLFFPEIVQPSFLPEEYVLIGNVVGDGEVLCFSKDTKKYVTYFEGKVNLEYDNLKSFLNSVKRDIKGELPRLDLSEEDLMRMKETLDKIRNAEK